MRSLLTALAPCLLLSIPAAAADDAALRKCREIKESTARLACYDALPVTGTPRAAPGTPAPSRPASPAMPSPPPASASGTTATPQGGGAQAAATQSAANLESSFGMENRAPSAQLPSIESHIPGVFLGWSQYTTIRLANGQVWQVVDEDSRRMRLQDPKVRIRRGMMGAFYLEFEAHNYAPRVRRLQ